MGSGSFYTGGVNVTPLPINQPSGNFTWGAPIADLAANAAAAAHQRQATSGQPTSHQAAPQPKPVDPTKNTPAHAATQYANGQQVIVPGYTDPNTGYPQGTGPRQAPASGSAATGSTAVGAATPGATNIPQNDHAANIGGTPVSLSDWAIQHLIDHHNDTPGSGGPAPTAGGPGAQP